MTEKRFTVHIRWYNYEKTEGEIELKDNGQPLLISESVEDVRYLKEMLNELNDGNEQLKKIIEDNIDFKTIFSDRDLNDICNEMGYELSENEIKLQRLEKENEQLKSEINMLKTTIGRNEGYIDRLTHKGEWR